MTEPLSAIDPGERTEPSVGPILRYNSRGILLMIGGIANAIAAVGRLPSALQIVILTTDALAGVRKPRGAKVLQCQVVSVSGHLGRFRVMAAGRDEPLDVGPLSGNADGLFDIVLDLSSPPLIDTEVFPPGYLAPCGDELHLDHALAQVPRLIGEFTKPRYVTYRPEICVHARKGNVGCSACLDACPAGAIVAAGDTVSVDLFRCLGCGTCTAVCPSGALTHAYARWDDISEQVASLLEEARHSESGAPIILFSESNGANGLADAIALSTLQGAVLPVAVASLAVVGPEMWLAALADGAAAVITVIPSDAPPTVHRVLADQASVARQILTELGEDQERCRLIDASDEEGSLVELSSPRAMDAHALTTGDRRTALFLAVQALAAGAPNQPDSIALPAWVAYGEIAVDSAACTLCFSCVDVCPFKALAIGEDGASLEFVETSCVQCGLCNATCPEAAIELAPRLLLDPETRRCPRRLHRGEIARCIECGAPFMPQAMLDAVLNSISASSGSSDEAMKYLRVCPQCRAESAMREQFIGSSKRQE
jgi:ferredoxin